MKISLFGFLLVPMLCLGVLTQAQQAQILNDNQGKPVMEQSYVDVEGSPYLANGKTITTKLKYDLVKDGLLFQSPRDSMALVFVTPVKSFNFGVFGVDETNLVPIIFSNGYPDIDD